MGEGEPKVGEDEPKSGRVWVKSGRIWAKVGEGTKSDENSCYNPIKNFPCFEVLK